MEPPKKWICSRRNLCQAQNKFLPCKYTWEMMFHSQISHPFLSIDRFIIIPQLSLSAVASPMLAHHTMGSIMPHCRNKQSSHCSDPCSTYPFSLLICTCWATIFPFDGIFL
jgi:hypothetical protein